MNCSLLDTGQEGVDIHCSKRHLSCSGDSWTPVWVAWEGSNFVPLSEVSRLGASLNFKLLYVVKRDVNSGCASIFFEEAFTSTLTSERAQLPTVANSFKCLKLNGMDLGLSDLPLPYDSSSDPVGPMSWSPVSAFIIAFRFPCCIQQQIFATPKFEQP